jgi:hypothetical protein
MTGISKTHKFYLNNSLVTTTKETYTANHTENIMYTKYPENNKNFVTEYKNGNKVYQYYYYNSLFRGKFIEA